MSTRLVSTTIGPLKSGDTIVHTLTVLDDNDVAVDLNGATILYQWLRKLGSTPVVNLSTGDSPITIVINDNTDSPPVKNIVVVTIDKALVEPLQGDYRWEAEATDVSAQRQTIGFGTIGFIADLIS